MRLAVISDVHGNLDALAAFFALGERYDALWMLGDQVNYGPEPAAVVALIRARADLVVQGNHDFAVAHEDDSRWSARFRPIAEPTRRHASAALSDAEKRYLRDLPLTLGAAVDGMRCRLVHATPSDPHYGRLAPEAEGWAGELARVEEEVLLVGHSHQPFIRRIGDRTIVNPGSIGQPRSGDPRGSYALCADGEWSLHRFAYPVEATAAKIAAIGYPPEVEAELLRILRTGA